MPRCCSACYSYSTSQNGKWWIIRLLYMAVFVVVVGGIILLVLCFAIKPVQVKATIEDARLNNFSLATTRSGSTATAPSLVYNISIALTIRNPNGLPLRYTKPLVAALVFHDRLLGNITVMDKGSTHGIFRAKKKLRLRHANETVLPYVLDDAAAMDFKKQNVTGVFKIGVRLSGEIAFQWRRMVRDRTLAISCPLSLQLAPPGPVVVVFRKVSCKIEKPQKNYF